jgi:5'-nucleotidase
MPYTLDDKLVVGITTRALFDLTEANQVYESEGLKAYRAYELAHERDQLAPGTAFRLVKALLGINQRAGRKLVEVVVISRNDAESAVRVFNSIEAYGLNIERGAFRGGRDPWSFLKVFQCSLFLSAEPSAVTEALRVKVPAALVLSPPENLLEDDASEVRIAFDGDAVLFGDESERIYQRDGLEAFQQHELVNAAKPMDPGPFEPFLRALKRLQDQFNEGEAPVRTALVTSRNAPAHMRVIYTLREWGVRIDEAYFLGGLDKTPTLEALRPHIFFDDQMSHLDAAKAAVPSAHVIPVGSQLEAFEVVPDLTTPLGPMVVIPPMEVPSPAQVAAGVGPQVGPAKEEVAQESVDSARPVKAGRGRVARVNRGSRAT